MKPQELLQGLKNPQWRLSNLYWIVDKKGRRTLFKPNSTQTKYLNEATGHDLILKARQLGYSTLACLIALDECVFYNDWAALIVAHTRDDAEKLFASKILYAWNNLPTLIKQLKPTTHLTRSQIKWQHGSSIQVSNSGRGGSFQRIHISEFGKLCARFPDRAREVVTGTLPAAGKNPITIESTAEGQEGYFFQFYEMAKRNEGQFKLHFAPWWIDPDYTAHPNSNTITNNHRIYFDRLKYEFKINLSPEQQAWWIAQEKILGGDMKRENPSHPDEAFEQAIEGAFFSLQMTHADATGAIGRYPYDPKYPVNTFWDIGLDYTVIWFHQFIHKRHKMIHYYEKSGEHISHYANYLSNWAKEHNNAQYNEHFWPHDGKQSNIAIEHDKITVAQQHGIHPITPVPRTTNKMDAIEAARTILTDTDFNETTTAQGIKRLRHYRKKWNETSGCWTDKPLHDDNSHAADAFMTLAQSWNNTHNNNQILKSQSKLRKLIPAWAS